MSKDTFRLLIFAGIVAALFTTSAAPAYAHANLVKCTIANHQVFTTSHEPTKVTGTFAQNLNPDHSWMQVFEGTGDHGLVTNQKSQISISNSKLMTLKLPKMGVGSYYIIWYTHSAQDGHFAAGIVYFSVKKG